MARSEQDREDLMREATALVERGRLHVGSVEVVLGFRACGSGSIFFGSEPVYHFNAANQLRRAHAGGQLYKAEQGRLVALARQRQANEVLLVRHSLTAEEATTFLKDFEVRRQNLINELSNGRAAFTQVVSAGIDFPTRVTKWLKALAPPLTIAATPRAG